MGRYTLKIETGGLVPGGGLYQLAKEPMASRKSFPTCCQSLRMASVSRWKPVLRSGMSSRVCPVMSKAEANPLRNVGNLICGFAFFILYNLRQMTKKIKKAHCLTLNRTIQEAAANMARKFDGSKVKRDEGEVYGKGGGQSKQYFVYEKTGRLPGKNKRK